MEEVIASFQFRQRQHVRWWGDPQSVYEVRWRRWVEPVLFAAYPEYGLVAIGQPPGSLPRLVWVLESDIDALEPPPC